MTEFVLQAIKLSKLEFLQKTFLHVAELAVEMVAMEDIHLEPGTISNLMEFPLDGFMVIKNGACLTALPHVTTTQPENINHVVHQSQHQPVKRHAHQDTPQTIIAINGLPHLSIQYHQVLKKSKLKS